MNTRRAITLGAFLALGALLVVTPLRAWALELVLWVKAQGPAAAVAFAAIYVVAAVLLLPASVFTLGAGFVYGVGGGTLVVFPAAVLASLLAFAVARRYARDTVQRRVTRHGRFGAIDRAIGRNGFKITLLLRLSPLVPYGLLNYALGITAVRARDYGVATMLGMLPGTVMYVYLGSLVTSATQLAHAPSRGWLYWLGAVFTVFGTVGVTWIGRRELRRELAEVVA